MYQLYMREDEQINDILKALLSDEEDLSKAEVYQMVLKLVHQQGKVPFYEHYRVSAKDKTELHNKVNKILEDNKKILAGLDENTSKQVADNKKQVEEQINKRKYKLQSKKKNDVSGNDTNLVTGASSNGIEDNETVQDQKLQNTANAGGYDGESETPKDKEQQSPPDTSSKDQSEPPKEEEQIDLANLTPEQFQNVINRIAECHGKELANLTPENKQRLVGLLCSDEVMKVVDDEILSKIKENPSLLSNKEELDKTIAESMTKGKLKEVLQGFDKAIKEATKAVPPTRPNQPQQPMNPLVAIFKTLIECLYKIIDAIFGTNMSAPPQP